MTDYEIHSANLFEVCEDLYGLFDKNFMTIPNTTVEKVKEQISDTWNRRYPKDSMNMDIYLYILQSGKDVLIRKI